MDNGIEIKKTEGGILINGTRFVPDAEAESVVSEYFFPEFWENRIILKCKSTINIIIELLNPAFTFKSGLFG